MTTETNFTAADYRVRAVITKSSYDGGIVVETYWDPIAGAPPLDRPHSFGINCGQNHKLAERLARCVDAQKCFEDIAVAVDVNGKTYMRKTCLVWGRQLNADLKRLGF